ncbi:MAG: DegQ family serine endoprotease [Pseudomonadota bacterium]
MPITRSPLVSVVCAGAALTGLLTAGAASAALPVAVDGQPLPSLAPMIKEVAPAVVNIATEGTVEAEQPGEDSPFNDPFLRRFFGNPGQPQQPRPQRSLGSGVIVDAAQGIIVTNHHVVASADEITISLYDGTELSATLVGSDEPSDIAVLRVEEMDGVELSQVSLSDSDVLEVGDFVVAIGNPFGLTSTVTSGIVSALGRSGVNIESYEDFIQTDASINPGNSGGALLNLRGELVGINTAIISRSGGNIGIGFAIPINMASTIMDQILEFGEVRRGLLGVNIYTVDSAVASEMRLSVNNGALVSDVVPQSAADRGGIRAGDVIVGVNGEEVDSAAELRNMIGLMRPDDEVEVTLVRKGKERTVKTRLGSAQPVEEPLQAATLHEGLEGAEFSNIDDDMPEFASVAGVLVTSVVNNSPAAVRGLRAGDVVTTVNSQPVSDIDEFTDAASGANVLFLEVVRDDRTRLVRIG